MNPLRWLYLAFRDFVCWQATPPLNLSEHAAGNMARGHNRLNPQDSRRGGVLR